MSNKAHLYFESRTPLMASVAHWLCLWARSRVLSRPADLATASKAAAMSPAVENPLAIIASSSGNSAEANRTGAVARPNRRSAAAGLPKADELRLHDSQFQMTMSR